MKKWLTENKIFFETIAAVLLSIMAITMAYWQYQIGKLQADIARIGAIPQINILRTKEKTRADFFGNEYVLVKNEGGIAKYINVEVATFLDVSAVKPSRPVTLINKSIPIVEYFTGTALTGQTKDTLATVIGSQNSERLFNLRRSAYGKQEEYESINIELKVYAKVNYTDIFGERYERFFIVEPVNGGIELPQKQGEQVFADWKQSIRQKSTIDFTKIDLNYLLKDLSNDKR
jgi:hypothetical protein